MSSQLLGVHHVSGIAGDPQSNINFYMGVLGLRLVKRTVNFDDPGTYHFYYGDEAGQPGTLLTFFPWPRAFQGQRGSGQVTVTAYSIPAGSMGYWLQRLDEHGVPHQPPVRRVDRETVTLFDPDGLQLMLVAHADVDDRFGWNQGPVPYEHALRGVYGVRMTVARCEATHDLLTDVMGFSLAGEEGPLARYQVGAVEPGRWLEVLCEPGNGRGRIAAGSVHHVAWRAADDAAQAVWRTRLQEAGINVTAVQDRLYFRSIYFREPSGVLFEIATDGPGFTFDEDAGALGSTLKLPPWLEARRGELVERLPALQVPA